MTGPKGKKKDDDQGMSDEGVGGLFSGASPGGALAGWGASVAADLTPEVPVVAAPVEPARPLSVIPQPVVPQPQDASVDDAETAKPVGFYVSASVASRFRKFRSQQGLTSTQVVLLAVEHANEKGIASVVEAARRPPKIQSKLFPIKPDDSDLRGLGPVQLQYKPTRAQRSVIDALVAESGLPDHTKFLAVVLNDFLPGRRDT
jgi:hypothetical protein